MDKVTYEAACGLWELIEDEAEANKGYARFLSKYDIQPDVEEKIRHIMAEEYKHTCDLLKIAEELTGIKAEGY